MNKFLFSLLLAAFVLTACDGKPTEMPDGGLAISDPGTSIEVAAGNEFKIVIDSNPTTGYQWKLVGALDEGIVQFVSNEYRASEPVMAGSGGKDVWTFKAVAAGETTVTLGHYPPSNDPVDPAETVTFTIVVK